MTLAQTRASGTLRQRSAFAVQHIMAAARFSRMCGEIELANKGEPLGDFFDSQIGAVSATLMLSTASLESNINEYLCEPDSVFPILQGDSPRFLVRLLERKSLLAAGEGSGLDIFPGTGKDLTPRTLTPKWNKLAYDV